MGLYGGFSSHITVPADDLCVIPDRKGIPLSHLAVIADAGTSPYQAAMRAEVQPGDLVVIIGITGGLGVYASQVCAALGAKEVIGIARNPERLKRAMDYGATHTIQITSDKDARAIRDEFRAYCGEKGIPNNYGWKIFEWTGTLNGQKIGLELLSYVGKLAICGFGMQRNEYQLSRLMAFDAEIFGSWGCLPKYYPDVLNLILEGKIQIEPFVETRPMSTIKEAFEEAHKSGLMKRIVLTPDF
jgi:6-hydroxycyclohex-1-ene-1-carbonyl-CoA dehydrogenase